MMGMQKNMIKNSEIKLHFFIWIIYSLYVMILDLISYRSNFNLVREFVVIVIQVWIFYSFFYCLKKFKGGSFLSFSRSIGLLILSISVTFYLNYLRGLVAEYYGANLFVNKAKFVVNSMTFYTQISIYALGYFFAQRSIQKEKQLRLSEQQQAETEKAKLEIENKNLRLQEDKIYLQNEKIKLEYNFLKAQINPHFLYNTLNFFYAKTLMHSAEAADGIAKLTDIMRYALQQGGADGKVFLEQEVEHLHNYIALQQMRFNNTIRIKFNTSGNIHSHRILPHILITLLENAFKHGDTLDPMHPITINLQALEDSIHFSIRNKVRIGPKDGPSTGVGLCNIADRLQMEYGDKQILQHNTDGTFFDVQLSITLQGINIPDSKKTVLTTNPIV
jgi:two-component system LytT family sensor kinase